MDTVHSRVFRSGNSEAVRLPKAVAFGANTEVTIERNGDTLTIRPAQDQAEAKRRLAAMLDRLDALDRPAGGVQKREPVEFPKRAGP